MKTIYHGEVVEYSTTEDLASKLAALLKKKEEDYHNLFNPKSVEPVQVSVDIINTEVTEPAPQVVIEPSELTQSVQVNRKNRQR